MTSIKPVDLLKPNRTMTGVISVDRPQQVMMFHQQARQHLG
jgi:hypothetical protein